MTSLAPSEQKNDLDISNNNSKIKNINKEIEIAQDDKRDGIIEFVAGAISIVVGIVEFHPTVSTSSGASVYGTTTRKGNSTLFCVCIGVGSILEIWDAYEWWDKAFTMITLTAKIFDIRFQPYYTKCKRERFSWKINDS